MFRFRYHVELRDGTPVEITPRIDRFVRRYYARWMKQVGTPPLDQHPFPYPWNYSWIVFFDGPIWDELHPELLLT
jgi:hypothetical protein